MYLLKSSYIWNRFDIFIFVLLFYNQIIRTQCKVIGTVFYFRCNKRCLRNGNYLLLQKYQATTLKWLLTLLLRIESISSNVYDEHEDCVGIIMYWSPWNISRRLLQCWLQLHIIIINVSRHTYIWSRSADGACFTCSIIVLIPCFPIQEFPFFWWELHEEKSHLSLIFADLFWQFDKFYHNNGYSLQHPIRSIYQTNIFYWMLFNELAINLTLLPTVASHLSLMTRILSRSNRWTLEQKQISIKRRYTWETLPPTHFRSAVFTLWSNIVELLSEYRHDSAFVVRLYMN